MKTVFAMVGTHSAFTKAAKSHLTGCQVDDGVIDTSASESTVGSNFFVLGMEPDEDGLQANRKNSGFPSACWKAIVIRQKTMNISWKYTMKSGII